MHTLTLRALTAADVTFTVSIEEEESRPRAGVDFDSDEPAADKELERELNARLDRDDLWAWCCVVVKAEWNGYRGSNALGCCSYKDEADFRADGGDFEQMCDDALGDLNQKIRTIAEGVAQLLDVAIAPPAAV